MTQFGTIHPLKAWREREGLTLDAAAAGVETVRQVWYDWESGRRRPGAAALERIFHFTRGEIQPNDFYDMPRWRRALSAVLSAVGRKQAA